MPTDPAAGNCLCSSGAGERMPILTDIHGLTQLQQESVRTSFGTMPRLMTSTARRGSWVKTAATAWSAAAWTPLERRNYCLREDVVAAIFARFEEGASGANV
jgi:hypothetical protein